MSYEVQMTRSSVITTCAARKFLGVDSFTFPRLLSTCENFILDSL